MGIKQALYLDYAI